MPATSYRIAILFPADPAQLSATRVENSRLKEVAHALTSAGTEVVSAPYCDEIASEIEARLADLDFVLAWYNPFESGRDRSRLNAMLRALAARGVGVSAHPDVIDKMGTKDVLFPTQYLSWGTDARRFDPREQVKIAAHLQRRTKLDLGLFQKVEYFCAETDSRVMIERDFRFELPKTSATFFRNGCYETPAKNTIRRLSCRAYLNYTSNRANQSGHWPFW
jgi:hypothetical protein